MAQQLLVRSSFAVAVVVVVQICCRPVVRGKKRDLTDAISNWIIMNQFFCPYCFCNGDCVVFDHSFYLLYYFAFCFVALPLLLKDLYDLNWTESSSKGMNMLLHAFKRRVMKYEENVTWFSWVTFSDVIYYSTVISKSPPVACLIDISFVHVPARQWYQFSHKERIYFDVTFFTL